MATRTRDIFTTIHSEGALLPADLLQRIHEGDQKALDGLREADYHLSGERLTEATSRAWNRLQGAWSNFKAGQERLPEGDLGTSITRERWLLPLFETLGYGRLEVARSAEIDGKSYPISHRWRNVPIHLVSYQVKLDERMARVAGAASSSPHSLMQVYLNRSEDTLWGFVSNGFQLRILRDNASLTRAAYVEFDLKAMMDGEVYSDFVLLYLLCHQSRVEAEKPGDFWLEAWMKAAVEQGTRALDQLRDGVQRSIEHLGVGFIAHPANHQLRERLRGGGLDTQEYYRQLLRLVYRLLFLFAAEDRDLLLMPGADPAARGRYAEFYSTKRLRRLAEKLKGTRHSDLYEGLRVLMRLLSDEDAAAQAGRMPRTEGSNAPTMDQQRSVLGLAALGSFLFREEAVQDVIGCAISNRDLLEAVRALAFTEDRSARVLRQVDYRNMGPEELGSVYESLLELHPQISLEARKFVLATAAGHERKTTGSYYTPDSLVQALLDSALDPVIAEARREADPQQAILDLKICDPACGSGHFLIAAARRVARALASVRTGEDEPTPNAIRQAVRDVIGHCIYGVDINPMAVELCKVNLWMEALEPGKPLSFLDHRIQTGNSLLGTTPALIAKGIPNEAFNPIEGDDRKVVSELGRRNRQERKAREHGGMQNYLPGMEPWAHYHAMNREIASISNLRDATVEDIRQIESRYEQYIRSTHHNRAKLEADAWCAAFVWEKVANAVPPMTDLTFRRLQEGSLPDAMRGEIFYLADKYEFFHWHVRFPDVFTVPENIEDAENAITGWNGGFSAVLGNPPWERLTIKEKEWFAERNPEIADAPNAAARKRLISTLINRAPSLYAEFLLDKRKADGELHLARVSGLFPLTAVGDINTYQLFAELGTTLLNIQGRSGLILPTGIATDYPNRFFFASIVNNKSLVSLYDFENRDHLFQALHTKTKFCLLTLSTVPVEEALFGFLLTKVEDLYDDLKIFPLSTMDFLLFSPNTLTCPLFRTNIDAAVTRGLYQRVPVMVHDANGQNPWNIKFTTMFHMANDSALFLDNPQDSALPLYESKMFYLFDHRWSTQNNGITRNLTDEEKQDPACLPNCRYWVLEEEVETRIPQYWTKNWLLSVRNITDSRNERSAVFCVIPRVGVGASASVFFIDSLFDERLITCLLGNLNSIVFDYMVRQKLGGTNLTQTILHQIPVIPPRQYTSHDIDFILPRIIELIYTTGNMQDFANDMGFQGQPFPWNAERRLVLRAELDAYYASLYGLTRDELSYILDPTIIYGDAFSGETFRVLKLNEIREYGEYRTQQLVLESWDQLFG